MTFLLVVLNSVTKALADLNGNDSMDLPKRRDDSDSWIENTHLVTPNKGISINNWIVFGHILYHILYHIGLLFHHRS